MSTDSKSQELTAGRPSKYNSNEDRKRAQQTSKRKAFLRYYQRNKKRLNTLRNERIREKNGTVRRYREKGESGSSVESKKKVF